jgi:two-component system, LytTR family, sensor kinase
MRESRDELQAGPSSPNRFRLRPGELLGIVLFWAFLATLTATGRLLDPRIPELRPEISSAVISLAFIEYSIWAALTVPIIWLVSRLTADGARRVGRGVLLVALGLGIAIGVSAILATFRAHLLPFPNGARLSRTSSILRGEFVGDLIVYFAILGAALARNYFLQSQVRLMDTRRLQAQAAELNAQLAEAQLSLLRTQLNPHFLFNTLNAISSLVERDPRGVRRMIARLSELLRHTLDQPAEQEISLDREIELLRRYLDIMEVRFQGRLAVTLDVADDVRDALVPHLILQPLVENAFKHGIGATEGPGRLVVEAARSGEDVVLAVRDNGPGLIAPRTGGGGGLGLRNTMARLEHLYGARQRLTLRPATDGSGTIAEVVLPYHTAQQPSAT